MLAIRLQRTGRKGHAQFRLVVQDARRSPTSGRLVAQLGHHDPHSKQTVIDKEKAKFYLEHGAQPSPRVAGLLKSEKVALPKWVEAPGKKSRTIRTPDKLRRNRPPEPKAEKQAAEPAAEAPVDEPAEVLTEAAPEAEKVEETPTAAEEESKTEAPTELAEAPAPEPAAEPKDESKTPEPADAKN